MTVEQLIAIVPLLGVLAASCVFDWRERRIPNWLTLPAAVAGIAAAFGAHALVTPLGAAAGLGVAFAIGTGMFLIGAWGGGDVKLLAAVGAWVGLKPVLVVFVLAALVALVIVCVQTLVKGKFGKLVGNSALLTVNLMHTKDLGVAHVAETGAACQSVDKPLPYAVPITAAVLLLVGSHFA